MTWKYRRHPKSALRCAYYAVGRVLTVGGEDVLLREQHLSDRLAVMIRECAWCRDILECGLSETDEVSHTICESCESRMRLDASDKDFVLLLQAVASTS